MAVEESSKKKWDRLKRELQDSILNDYPNPERKGCPGDSKIRSIAERATDEDVENDAEWHHLTHCSECYREFLRFRRGLKSEAQRRRKVTLYVGVASACVVIFLSFVYLRTASSNPDRRPQNAELAFSEMTIDIPTMARSESARVNTPIILQRKPTELTVNLPIGSKAGKYEFRLLNGDQKMIAADATASIADGITSFTVKLDLSKVLAGSYSMSVRQPPWDWSYVPVVVR